MKIEYKNIKNKGETIIEVVIAVVISTMVLTSTFVMLNRAISTNVNVRNRVIALNIAREGIEAVRNIRDTNWLKYSGDRREKWLCQDTVGVDQCASGGTNDKLGTRQYSINYNEGDQRYYLVDGVENTLMDLSDSETPETKYAEYKLYYENSINRYTHRSSPTTYPTPFYRQIQIVVHAGDDTLPDGVGGVCSTSPQCQERKMEVISVVQWKEEGAVRGLALEHHLYDFYEREDY